MNESNKAVLHRSKLKALLLFAIIASAAATVFLLANAALVPVEPKRPTPLYSPKPVRSAAPPSIIQAPSYATASVSSTRPRPKPTRTVDATPLSEPIIVLMNPIYGGP